MNIGDRVMVNEPNHRMYGKVGLIILKGSHFYTWAVEIDGSTYGFLETELLVIPDSPALREMVKKLDERPRTQGCLGSYHRRDGQHPYQPQASYLER